MATMRRLLLSIAKAILPDRFIEWYRRRRALRRYLKALSYEVFHRQVRLDLQELEGSVIARRDGFYDRVARDVLERTELILQELDRRIEGVSARHGTQLRDLRNEVAELRSMVEMGLSSNGPVDAAAAPAPSPQTGAAVDR
jgi:hypothetical protein